jgi:anti-anti-sigma factor
LDVQRDDARTILQILGELDLATVHLLRETGLAELERQGCESLILDLERMTFLDSTGIGACVELRNIALKNGQSLQLRSVPVATVRTLTIAGLATIFGLDTPSDDGDRTH